MQKHQLNSWLYFGDTTNCKVRTLEHLCPFLTMPTKKHQSWLCSRDIANIKMVQTDWLRPFWLSSHEADFSQIWDLRRNTANGINLRSRTNSNKLMTKFFNNCQFWEAKQIFPTAQNSEKTNYPILRRHLRHFVIQTLFIWLCNSEAYLRPSKTSLMKLFSKKVNGLTLSCWRFIKKLVHWFALQFNGLVSIW